MRETILRCDICKEVVGHLYTVDIDNPLNTDSDRIGYVFKEVPYGRLTSDGVWEVEACGKCIKREIYDVLANKR